MMLAHEAIEKLGIMQDLAEYTPVLCGTIPIAIDVEGSDLDIVMEVHDAEIFKERIVALYSHCEDFRWKEKQIRDRPVYKANFRYEGFEFELFGQPVPVKEQYAYCHMIVEEELMKRDPSLREQVIKLKSEGIKTEPAFAQLLGLTGNPYVALMDLGKVMGLFK
ncbi:DUF4269 domain-containing protein [Paenibacillus glycanilyticus]|uniref:DUF4269 domain-containing protein n=1 Tax=Paenibacillus glycanilyticus TaxID=126569 RepID=UPI0020407852|nr:DUF4269 domain-containing protein [Paenibacillus glycanilyticus]MCM3625969.1 DUF4269 domain-containing protein [Paenibacillus glycanilyticus]